MNRTERIPQPLIDQVLGSLDNWLSNLMSVGYPLAIDEGHYLFPIYLQLRARPEPVPVLSIIYHFGEQGATCYDVSASHNPDFTTIVFYLKAPLLLGQASQVVSTGEST